MALITVAIDGPAGAGKSTIMEAVAKRLNLKTLDTGAMYRAAGLKMLDMGVDIENEAAVAKACADVDVEARYIGGEQHTYACGDDMTARLHTDDASRASKLVSCVREVRLKLVEAQKKFAEGESVIMNGRDIGTMVLPNATAKIFLTASPEVRAERRFRELAEGGAVTDYETVLAGIIERDRSDTTRVNSPLVMAKGAEIVDSSCMSEEETIEAVVEIVRKKACKA